MLAVRIFNEVVLQNAYVAELDGQDHPYTGGKHAL